MKRHLLDTAPLAAYLHNRPTAVAMITPWMKQGIVATSILVHAEVTEYIKGLPDYPKRKEHLRKLLEVVYLYFLTYPILERYAEIRRSFRLPLGKGLIGDIDTLIAATALERNLTVITSDTDFQRVPGLKLSLLTSL